MPSKKDPEMIEWTNPDQMPDGPCLVLFYGENCPPCNALKRKLTDEPTSVPVYTINAMTQPTLAARYRVRSVPVLLGMGAHDTMGRWTALPNGGVSSVVATTLGGGV